MDSWTLRKCAWRSCRSGMHNMIFTSKCRDLYQIYLRTRNGHTCIQEISNRPLLCDIDSMQVPKFRDRDAQSSAVVSLMLKIENIVWTIFIIVSIYWELVFVISFGNCIWHVWCWDLQSISLQIIGNILDTWQISGVSGFSVPMDGSLVAQETIFDVAFHPKD